MAIVVEVEEKFQTIVQAFEAALTEVRTALRQAEQGQLDYREVELRLAEASGKVECAGHQVVLQSLDLDAPRVLVNGVPHRRVNREIEATYYTMAGPVVVKRTLYRKEGERSGPTVDAVSLRAGVVGEGWLPRTAQAMAHECQRGPSREAAAASSQWRRLPYSRCAFEDVAHAVGTLYGDARQSIERALIEAYEPPAEATSVSVSLDRVSIPMEEPRPRPPGRPKKDAPKRPISRVYRMAYAATVTLHDKAGEALHTIRYGRTPKGDVDGLCEGLADDVSELLKKRPDLKISLLCDGAPEMWNWLNAHINAEQFGREITRRVDFWHFAEKLGKAASILCSTPEEVDALTRRWRLELLNCSSAAEDILATLTASGREGVRVGDACPVHDAMTYIENHRGYFDYAAARRAGLPIGSGNVEATCKSLFEVRLKRSGCRWKEDTATHIIDLRALALSDRWDDAIALAVAPRRAVVTLELPRTQRRRAA